MKRFKKNAILISLIGMLCSNIMACSSDTQSTINQIDIQKEYEVTDENDELSYLLNADEFENQDYSEEIETEENTEEILDDQDVVYQNDNVSVRSLPVVTATANVNIRDSIGGEILGVLPEGHNLELLEEIDDTHYKVLYYGQEAYVSADYAIPSTILDINNDILKMFYAEEDKEIFIPSYLSQSGEDEYKPLNKYECFEVYEETDDYFLVKTSDYVGYITKEGLKELNGTFVVIDISDQNLKLYQENGVILDVPVITGKPSTPTPTGAYEIFEVTHDRYLVGRNNSYKSWVSIMMNFNGNIGLHDAEYHYDENGRYCGWRATNVFGGNTNKNNGSHGCVNMRYNDVMFVFAHTELGTIVLVKK